MATDSKAILETVAQIERLLDDRIDLVPLFKDLRSNQKDRQSLEFTALHAAVTYYLSRGLHDDAVRPGPLIPFFEAGHIAIPPPIHDADEAWHEVWANAAEVATHPALLARLHDLLWLTRHGTGPHRPHRHAQSAFTSYLAAAKAPWSAAKMPSDEDNTSRDRVPALDYLRRARDLGRELGRANADAEVANVALSALRMELSRVREGDRLGIAGQLFALAVECGSGDLMGPLAECLEKMRGLYGSDDWAVDTLFDHEIQFARRFADLAAMRRLQKEQARHWLTAARDANPGLDQLWRIRRTIEMAERTGDSELIREARADLKCVELSGPDFHSASIEVPLPAADIDALVAKIVGEDSLPDALCRLALLDPDSWDEEGVQRVVGRMSSVVLDLVQINELDEAGRLVFAPSTPDERAQYKEAQARQLLLGMSRTALIEPALAGIRERHWTDAAGAELHGFFAAAWPDRWIAEGLARAFLYWRRDAGEEATLLALRRIERIVRDLSQECGGATWVQPKPKSPGHAQGLGAMLRQLRDHVDDPLWQYLNWTLSDPLGLNLRAKYFHALTRRCLRRWRMP